MARTTTNSMFAKALEILARMSAASAVALLTPVELAGPEPPPTPRYPEHKTTNLTRLPSLRILRTLGIVSTNFLHWASGCSPLRRSSERLGRAIPGGSVRECHMSEPL